MVVELSAGGPEPCEGRAPALPGGHDEEVVGKVAYMAWIVHSTWTAIVTRFCGLRLYQNSMSFFRQPYLR